MSLSHFSGSSLFFVCLPVCFCIQGIQRWEIWFGWWIIENLCWSYFLTSNVLCLKRKMSVPQRGLLWPHCLPSYPIYNHLPCYPNVEDIEQRVLRPTTHPPNTSPPKDLEGREWGRKTPQTPSSSTLPSPARDSPIGRTQTERSMWKTVQLDLEGIGKISPHPCHSLSF